MSRGVPDPGEFCECRECSARPGSPTLCPACLHNRELIGVYETQRDDARAQVRHAAAVLRGLGAAAQAVQRLLDEEQ